MYFFLSLLEFKIPVMATIKCGDLPFTCTQGLLNLVAPHSSRRHFLQRIKENWKDRIKSSCAEYSSSGYNATV